MDDSPEKKMIRFDSIPNLIRYDTIQYSQSTHILVHISRLWYCWQPIRSKCL